MKIALVHNFHSDAVPSGENVVVDSEAEALRRAGHEVRIVGVRNDDMAAKPLHAARGAVTVISGFGISPLSLLDGLQPDVVHVHNLFPYLGRRWVRQLDVPLVVTLHNYRPLCANGYLFRDGRVCTRCPDGQRWSGVRYGCYRDSRLATLPLAVANLGGGAGDPLLRAASAILVLSERARRLYLDAGLPAAKLVRDWNFVPDHLAPAIGTSYGDAWLFVGRLSEEKGIDRLLAEWPADRRLVIVGDGPLRSALEASAAQKPVTFLGSVSRSRVLDEMRRATGLVMPSLWYEGFPVVYIEALSVGLPTLAFPPNTVADAVALEGTGVVAEWGRLPRALARAEERFDRLRARCRAVFEDQYAERAWVRRRIRLYEELIGRARAPETPTQATGCGEGR
ncbi:MAG: glycosyltransferase family 4 protein [Egibacteraceae bacterium]